MTSSTAAPTRFGRRESRGILLGLTAAQLGVVTVALAVAVGAVYSSGAAGLVSASPAWGLLLAVGTVSVSDRPLVDWTPVAAEWCIRKALGRTTAALSTRGRDSDTVLVPGLARRIDLVDCPSAGAVLAIDRAAGTVCTALRVDGTGFLLADGATQDHRVSAWGRVLAALCQQRDVVRVQVLVRTRPGGMSRPRAWWAEHCVQRGDTVTTELVRLLDTSFVDPWVHEAFVAVSMKLARGRQRGMSSTDVEATATTLSNVEAALEAAEVRSSGWLDREHLLDAIRASYEPGPSGRAEGVMTTSVATGVDEHWTHLVTGEAVHATYWIAEWPRSDVHPGFLQPMLLESAARRTFSLTAEPLPIAKALREIRRAKAEHAADAVQRARLGQVESEVTRAEVAELARREAELVAGHGDVRFTGLVSVSADDEPELARRCAALETAAAQSLCDVRRLVGQQGAAHLAACLPLARGVL